MIFDTHIHTEFSFDSDMPLLAARRRAKELQIGLIATEHLDLDYPEKGAFTLDVEKYFSAYQAQRGADFLLGIELGMQASCAMKARTIVQAADFDYVLGSIHLVDHADLYCKEVYEGRSKREVYTSYFQTMCSCVAQHPFIDALGHIDYIARYATYADPEIHHSEFGELIDAVLRKIVDQGIALEVNARRFADRETAEALLPVYQRYYALGGRLVTLGSDAHTPADIGGNFTLALDFIERCNLRAVYFKRREAVYVR